MRSFFSFCEYAFGRSLLRFWEKLSQLLGAAFSAFARSFLNSWESFWRNLCCYSWVMSDRMLGTNFVWGIPEGIFEEIVREISLGIPGDSLRVRPEEILKKSFEDFFWIDLWRNQWRKSWINCRGTFEDCHLKLCLELRIFLGEIVVESVHKFLEELHID